MMALQVQVDQEVAVSEMAVLGAQEILLQPHHHKEMLVGLLPAPLRFLPVAVVGVLEQLAELLPVVLVEMVALV
jgi:hypothetical protein